jgi:CubicO group peptidase (beta-lactamase class C family)
LRGVIPDQDWVPLALQAGKNKLLVQVFNASMGWGITARMLTIEQVKDGFADAAVQLPLDKLQLILASGVDINQKNALGLTAFHVATQKNNKARAQWLLANGSNANITMPASEQLVQNFIKNGISTDLAGASYLVINNGKVITKGGLGFADLANSQPITTSTKFRIGSLTKQFTAAAILKLVEAGQVSLDDQVNQYLPDFPKGENVTIRQLLNHTSGIANYTQDPNFWEQPEKYYTKEDMLNLIESLGYDFESGERFGYSNSGYYILGVIIEEVSEQSLATFFEQTFFKPLKMYHSGIYQNGYNYQNEAIGRRLEDGKVVAAADTNMSQPAAAGAMYSTVEDLYIWNKALHNGQVLPLNLYQQMTSPGPLNHGNTLNHYGFGIGLNHFQGHQSLAHRGSIHGFSNYMGVIPDLGYQYILLTNMMAGHTTFTELPFTRIAELTQIN